MRDMLVNTISNNRIGTTSYFLTGNAFTEIFAKNGSLLDNVNAFSVLFTLGLAKKKFV